MVPGMPSLLLLVGGVFCVLLVVSGKEGKGGRQTGRKRERENMPWKHAMPAS
jgi:hypothetical protein